MPRIRCTHKLLKLLGKEAARAAREDNSDESDLDWYANLFYVDGRKCLMFTNVGTLASFVALDILKDDVADLPSFFWGRYRDFLGSLQATADQIEHELESYQELEIGKSSNRKVLGSMSSLVNDVIYAAAMEGGIEHASEIDVSAQLIWTPIGNPIVKPISELEKRIPGIRTSFDPFGGLRSLPSSALTEFIQTSDSPLGELGYYGLRGFLFAILTAPEMIMPSEWMEVLLDNDETQFASQEHASQVFELIHEEYNRLNEGILEGEGVSVLDCPIREDVMANFDSTAPLHEWSVGFRFGYDWLGNLWEEAATPEEFKLVDMLVSTLVLFSSRELAIDLIAGAGYAESDLEDIATTACETFHDASADLAKIGRGISARRKARSDQFRPGSALGDGAPS